MAQLHPAVRRGLAAFLWAALGIELVDELVDGASGAAWPLLQTDLHLDYLHIGLLLSVPAVLANLVEPPLGLLADLGHRRRLVLGGGVLFALALALWAVAGGFWPLLLAITLFFPASGLFVSLTQAALMDAAPDRREQNMARWALAGSLGNVLGPLLVGAAVTAGAGWRPAFALLAALAVLAGIGAARSSAFLADPGAHDAPPLGAGLRDGLRAAVAALRRREVIGALAMLELANLLMDVFRGFLALYFVDVAHAGAAGAALAVAVFTAVGLVGDALVIPLLERVPGVAYLRVSAALSLAAFAAFLLAPGVPAKLVLLGALGLLNAGWYAILQARVYGLVPDRSGTVMAMGSVSGMIGGLVPLALGALAERAGIGAAMWLLALGPISLLVGLPRGPGR